MKNVKGFLVLGLLATQFAFAGNAFSGIKMDGRDVIRIEIGNEDEEVPRSADRVTYLTQSNRQLRKRVHRLEQALRQMQDQIYRLEGIASAPVVAVNSVKEYTCYIKTTFKGTVYGKGSSEVEARAKALQSCDEADGGFSCDDSNVKCGS